MKIKGIMLITVMLLTIFMMGVVSAGDTSDFNDTISTGTVEESMVDSVDNVTSEDNGLLLASSGEDDLGEGEITEEDFEPWVADHECAGAEWNPTIVNVNFDDNVQDGSINLVIVKDDDNTFTDSINIGDADGNEIRWGLDDLNILDEPGIYTISLDYQIGENVIPLIEDFTFKLTQFNYAVLGYVYYAYPFDVVRIYLNDEEEYLIEVYVNDNEDPYEPSGENPFRWTLDDLGIDQEGTYSITVRSYIGDDLFEEVTNTLTVDGIYGDKTWLYSSDFGLASWEIDGPVLYLLCSGNNINQHLTLYVNDNQVDDFNSEEFMSWTLKDLGIDRNDGYEIRLFNDEGDEIANKWLDVYGMISEDSFNSWVSSHESKNSEDNPCIVNVHAHGDLSEGDVVVTIVNSEGINKTYTKTFEDDADEHNDVIWTLDELNEIINQVGNYIFNVTYINGETQVDLITDFTFSLTEFDYNVYEGGIYIDYPFDVIRIWDESLDVEVYVDNSTDPVQSGGTDPLRWTLADLGINAPGDYTITVNANKEGVEDSFSYVLNVFNESEELIFYSNSLGVREWETDDSVLYLVSREEDNGRTLRIVINGNDDDAIEFEIDETVMSWNLASLGITENGGYEISLFEGEDEIAGTYLDVWGLEEQIRVDIWDENEQGKLYNDEPGAVISVDVPEDKRYGTIIVTVNDEDEYSWEVDWEDNYHEWSLSDLGMTDEGEYSIEVKHVVYDEDEMVSEDILAEETLMVYTFNNDEFRAILDNDSETLNVYCYEEGIIFITVERESDEEEPEIVNETDFVIENIGEWMEFSLKDLGFVHDGAYYSFDVVIENSEGEEVYHFNGGHSVESVSPDVAEGDFYLDYESNVITVYVPNGNSGKLEVIVNGNVLYISNAYPDREYVWNFKTLNITETGDYTITVLFNGETIAESNINVIEFENDTFRVKCYYNDGVGYDIFCPEDAEGTIVVNVYDREQDDELVETHIIPIDDKYKGKWTGLEFETEYNLDENAFIEVEVDGKIINMEEIYDDGDYGVGFEVNHVKSDVSFYDGEVVIALIPYDRTIGNASINITSGEYSFYIKLSEFDGYEWDTGGYKFTLTKDDLNYFNELSDKDVIKFVFVHDKGKLTRWMSIKKEDDDFSLYGLTSSTGEFGTICAYGLEIIMEANTFSEDDEDEDESDETVKSDYFATVSIPDSFNVENGKINIVSGDNIIFSKNLSQIDHEYLYSVAGNRYYISFDDLNLENINDKDIVNITLTSNGEVINYLTLIHRIIDENSVFFEYFGNLEFSVHYGELANPEYGMGEQDGSFIYVMIPDVMDITGGNIIITRDDGTVLFNWSLDSFDNTDSRFVKQYSQFYQGYEYIIMANETIYSAFPENENLTFTFVCSDKTISHKGIVKDGSLYRIVVSDDVTQDMFEIIIPDNVLVNGNEFAVTIRNIGANRQSIGFGLGGGYFSVYVNGKRIEDLGRLNRYDGETELELTRLCSNTDGVNELTIYLGDLDIIENGVYDIRVTLNSAENDPITLQQESEIFSQNVTLTSNVKAENASSKAYTGFGMDPILVYLDTYYGDITSDVTGNITVLNSTDDEILFISDIKTLEHDEKGYYLKYSNFENKNFGDKILVLYEGNERSGNTTVNVTWKDVDPTDFAPTVNENVDDYFGDIVSLQVPALITEGKIIVTVKFNNSYFNPIHNINVTSDYDSHAVYRFDVAQIQANGGELAFSLSDLGFYVENGDYDIDVQFTADDENILDVSNSTSNVVLSTEIDMTISPTSRYTKDLSFAGVKIYDPSSASFAELFIDGVLYSHKTFDNGEINFTSSPKWDVGTHTAEIRVYNELGSVVKNILQDFETVIRTDDVEIEYDDTVREGKHAYITLNVPKKGNLTVQIDGIETLMEVSQGSNTIDLGVLSHGNHTIGIFYEETLDDGNITFYNGYITLTVEYESWLDIPYPFVLNYDDTVKFDLGSDATGYVWITVDNELYANRTLVDGCADIQITGQSFGKHNVTFTYSGDDTHESVSQTYEIDVKFLFKDDIVAEGYPLKESYTLTVILPEDAQGSVTLTVDDEIMGAYVDGLLGANAQGTYTEEVKNGKAVFNLNGLGMGEHKMFISYSGDGYYPGESYETVFNVAYYAVICEEVDGKRIVSVMLPENATGNLVIYNDNMKTQLYSIPVVGGKASVDLSKLTVGIYDLRAYYDGDDYEVRTFTDSFKVMPYVNITQDIIIGKNMTIYVDLNNSTGSLLIVLDGLAPALEEIVNGKVNYTFSTEEYTYGNHTATFYYIGNSFDPNLFNDVNKETGYSDPIKYDVNIKEIVVVPKTETDNDTYVELKIYDENGKFLPEASGFVDVTIIDRETGKYRNIILEVVNGIARLSTSDLKDGDYDIILNYLGDGKHGTFTLRDFLSIKHKLPSIVAYNLNIAYTSAKAYSVTVYKKDGSLASGVAVSFAINNKPYGNIITNSKGVASIKISKTPGTYKITSTAMGITVTKQLKVTKILSLKTVKVKRSAKKLVLKATLKKVDGKYLKGKKVTFKFKGKKYTAKTNKKGVAKVTIKKKVLKKLKKGKKVKYQVTYLKETVKKTAKVKK